MHADCSHRGCPQNLLDGSRYCYFHAKCHNGLITTTRADSSVTLLRVQEREAATAARRAYYASLLAPMPSLPTVEEVEALIETAQAPSG